MRKSGTLAPMLMLLVSAWVGLPGRAQTSKAEQDGFIVTRLEKLQVPNKKGRKATPRVKVGLGVTLFQEMSTKWVRVDHTKIFHTGDKVRLLIETNTDGYLYVFNAENGGNVKMIFPDGRLRSNNRVHAHVPVEVPSRSEPEHQWFMFDKVSGSERILVVISPRNLPGVPRSSELEAYCRNQGGDCDWVPPPALWARITAGASAASTPVLAHVNEAGSRGLGEETEAEAEAVTRGLGLPKAAPGPSVLKFNKQPGGAVSLFFDLIHR